MRVSGRGRESDSVSLWLELHLLSRKTDRSQAYPGGRKALGQLLCKCGITSHASPGGKAPVPLSPHLWQIRCWYRVAFQLRDLRL